jgi:basic membrane protein A and related proteins
MVPDDVKQMADDAAAKFKSGEESIFTIFTGPLLDQTGATKVEEGKAMTADELLGMQWFVQGVQGEIPQ